MPESLESDAKRWLTGLGVQISDPCGQVDRAHGVTRHPLHLAERHAVQVVGRATDQPVAAGIKQKLGQLPIGLIAGLPCQFHERHLDLRVAGRRRPFPFGRRAKDTADVIGKSSGHVQQPQTASHAPMSDGGLDQMSGRVQLVHLAEIAPTLPSPVKREVGIEVAVLFLRRSDFLNHSIHQPRQDGIVIRG